MEDKPETTVYGKLLHMHLELARKDFDGQDRKEMFEFIKKFEIFFPEQCKVWTDRYPGKS